MTLKHNREIIQIAKTKITDKAFRNSLLKAVFEGRDHSARIMSEGLKNKFKDNKSFARLDDLITDKFFG